jgi:tryptophan halogenase
MRNIIIVGAGQAGLIAATLVKARFPEFNITVIASSTLGTIGVGEGSTEHWREYEKILGLDRAELIAKSAATFKYGVRFINWTDHTPDYFHSIPSDGPRFAQTFNASYSYIHAAGKQLTPTFMHRDLIDNMVLENLLQTNQLHFDSHKLNQFLKDHAINLGIEFIDDEVVGIERDSETGDITSVIGTRGKFSSDFVIDASGFNRVVFSHLGDPWEKSFSDVLPCDSALVFQTPTDYSIKPYTTATALSAGWHWDIPTQERRGHGYVFSSRHINADEAAEEVARSVDEPIGETRLIEFSPFQLKNSWQFNCVAVGLASNFVEPLEATSISATINQVRLLCSYLPTYRPNSTAPQSGYLRIFDSMMDNLVAMVAMHYVSDRKDTPMWLAQQSAPRPELLSNLIEIMSHRGPEQLDVPTTGYELFGANHFWFVGQGQGLIDVNGCRQGVIDHGSRQEIEEHLKTLQSSKREPTIAHRVILEQVAHQILGETLEWKFNQFDLKDMKRLDI